jgi:hypothetical protein
VDFPSFFLFSQVFQFTGFTTGLQSRRQLAGPAIRVVVMDEKTKKKSVEKRGVRKKKDLNGVSGRPSATKKKAKKQSKLNALKTTEQNQDHRKPTLEQIRLRAYFISEQRRSAGIAGDAHGDWLRAESELSTELLAEKS